MGLYSGGVITGRIFVSEIWGAYFQEGLFFGGAYSRNFTVFCEFAFTFSDVTSGRKKGYFSLSLFMGKNNRAKTQPTIVLEPKKGRKLNENWDPRVN